MIGKAASHVLPPPDICHLRVTRATLGNSHLMKKISARSQNPERMPKEEGTDGLCLGERTARRRGGREHEPAASRGAAGGTRGADGRGAAGGTRGADGRCGRIPRRGRRRRDASASFLMPRKLPEIFV